MAMGQAKAEWKADACIRLRGARTHNLQGFALDLPRGRLIVITGPSGSGKSSLAIDTLFAEGRRRYLETLRTETKAHFDQLPRPDLDALDGLPPTLCVSQHVVQPRPRSTLATITEIHDHLRLLFARAGTPHCPDCQIPVRKHTVAQIVRDTLAQEEGRKLYILAPLVQDVVGKHESALLHLRQSGFVRARIDGALIDVADLKPLSPRQSHTIEIVIDRLVLRSTVEDRLRESIASAIKHGEGRVTLADQDTGAWRDFAYSTKLACVRCQRTLPDLQPRDFHFNSPYGACPTCAGLGTVAEFDAEKVVPDRSWPLARVLARLQSLLPEGTDETILDAKMLASLADLLGSKKKIDAKKPLFDWPESAYKALLHGSAEHAFPGLLAVLRTLESKLAEQGVDDEIFAGLERQVTCPDCHGARLNPVARAVRFADRTLPQITTLTVEAALGWAEGWVRQANASRIVELLGREITNRLRFLNDVGLGYPTLDRSANTLSGGELQRARLATCLGGKLFGVCYVLDEPTLGLHSRDTERLLRSLRKLRDQGNTLIVVEHDEAVIRAADFLVDIGPGAGRYGGQLLAAGAVGEVLANPRSVTGKALLTSAAPAEEPRNSLSDPTAFQASLRIRNAREHNLKNLDVTIPLGRFVCFTGVSGSGKSTLAFDILRRAVRRHLGLVTPTPGLHDGIDGLEQISQLVDLDQKPAGRSPRSNPLTLTGLYAPLRELFAETRLAKLRGYRPNRFSFNIKGGRCEKCTGLGSERIGGTLLPDLTTPCPECRGSRFQRSTLEVLYKGKSIADVLALPIGEALDFFAAVPTLRPGLGTMNEVGLGYLPLGQAATTLSGGELQRLQLSNELRKPGTGKTLYLLDEPTSGLHFVDVDRLLAVLRKLVATGNTVLVIEHHPTVIQAADWVIDLGPDAGDAGGQIVAQGPPRTIADHPESLTGKFLKASLA